MKSPQACYGVGRLDTVCGLVLGLSESSNNMVEKVGDKGLVVERTEALYE